MSFFMKQQFDVFRYGRKLDANTYEALINLLNDDDMLFGVYQFYKITTAAWLYSSLEKTAYDSLVRKNHVNLIGYYAVPLHVVIGLTRVPYDVKQEPTKDAD